MLYTIKKFRDILLFHPFLLLYLFLSMSKTLKKTKFGARVGLISRGRQFGTEDFPLPSKSVLGPRQWHHLGCGHGGGTASLRGLVPRDPGGCPRAPWSFCCSSPEVLPAAPGAVPVCHCVRYQVQAMTQIHNLYLLSSTAIVKSCKMGS